MTKQWKKAGASVTSSQDNKKRKIVEIDDRRELKRIVFRRREIKWAVVAGKEEGDGYGHWWVVILEPDGKTPLESYGWWPSRHLGGIKETIQGVPGVLNGNSRAWAPLKLSLGLNDQHDPHHKDTKDLVEFSPIIEDSRTTDDVITCIRSFAKKYSKSVWAYPATGEDKANCHTFQEEMLVHCRLAEGTKRTISSTGSTTNTEAPKKTARPTYD